MCVWCSVTIPDLAVYVTQYTCLCVIECARLFSSFCVSWKKSLHQSDFTWRRVCELHVCAGGILLLENTLHRAIDITDNTTGLLT